MKQIVAGILLIHLSVNIACADSHFWAWFVDDSAAAELAVVAVSDQWIESDDLSITIAQDNTASAGASPYALGSEGGKKAFRQWLYNSEQWLPEPVDGTNLYQAVQLNFDSQGNQLGQQTVPDYFPSLHPTGTSSSVRLGAGDRPMPGDMAPYEFWVQSRYFKIDEQRGLLIAPDTQAYVITHLPAAAQAQSGDSENRYPMRLGDNPLIANMEITFPKLLSVVRFKDKLFISSHNGETASISIAGEPQWLGLMSGAKSAKTYFFTTGQKLNALVYDTVNKRWEFSQSEQGNAWAAAQTLPLDSGDRPVYMSDRFLVSQSLANRATYAIYRRGFISSWTEVKTVTLQAGEMLMDIAESTDNSLYMLLGVPDTGRLNLTVAEM